MRLIDADALKTALAEMWYERNISITGLSVAELIDEAPTIEPSKSTEQNVADVPSGDLISREELLKKLDRQIEWEEANAIPYEDADGGCILGLKKARKYVKLASSTEKPNANDCDLVSRQLLIGAIEKCGEEKIYPQALIETIKALPSAEPKGANLINRHDATTVIREECLKCNNLTNADLLGRILALPTSRQTDCTEFIEWLTEVVLDEEDWELNAVSYGEIIARKLKKLGLLEVKDGYYIRHIENDTKESDIVYRPSADRPQVNSNSAEEQIAETCDRPKFKLELITEIVRQLRHLDDYVADTCDRPKGEWVKYKRCEPVGDEIYAIMEAPDGKFFCNQCGKYAIKSDFCPHCGARMEGGAE